MFDPGDSYGLNLGDSQENGWESNAHFIWICLDRCKPQTIGKPQENHRKVVVSWDLTVFNPLVMTNIANEKCHL